MSNFFLAAHAENDFMENGLFYGILLLGGNILAAIARSGPLLRVARLLAIAFLLKVSSDLFFGGQVSVAAAITTDAILLGVFFRDAQTRLLPVPLFIAYCALLLMHCVKLAIPFDLLIINHSIVWMNVSASLYLIGCAAYRIEILARRRTRNSPIPRRLH